MPKKWIREEIEREDRQTVRQAERWTKNVRTEGQICKEKDRQTTDKPTCKQMDKKLDFYTQKI